MSYSHDWNQFGELPACSQSCDLLSPKVYSEDYQFAKDFLTKLGSGMHLDRPPVSKDEFEVLVRTFNECLLFMVTSMNLSKHYTNMFINHTMWMVSS